MPATIFLFPNLVLSSEQTKRLGKAVAPASLREFLADCDSFRCTDVFANPALSGFTASQWLWMLLSQRDTLAPTAPYTWKGLGGPKVDQEFWSLNGYRFEDGRLESSSDTFDIDDECDLRDLFSPLARRFNFDVQVLDGRFFFVRKQAWNTICVPWEAQRGKLKTPADGENASQWEELHQEIESALASSELNRRRNQEGKPRLDGFWVSGGGFDEQLLPYTQIRCLLSDDPYAKGVAEAAGISKNYIVSPKKGWPDCPEGDRLCVMTDFEDPRVKEDSELWTKTWDQTIEKLRTYMESCVGFEKYHPRLVACSGMRVSIVERTKEPAKGFSLFRKKYDHAADWLSAGNL